MMQRATRYQVVRGLVIALLLTLIGWAGYETHGTLRAHLLRDRLLDASTTEVPAIVKDMAPYRRWLDRLLREANPEAESKPDARKQLHISLALLPVDAGQIDYLQERLLGAAPHEVPVLRDALAPYQDELAERLWSVVEQPAKGKEGQRLRAAAALALYDPDSPRWEKVRDQVADDLVAVPSVHVAAWRDSLNPVRQNLLPPLAGIFGNNQRRETERSQATDVLADYAADQAPALANLLLEAEEKPFAVFFPKLQVHEKQARALLQAEWTGNCLRTRPTRTRRSWPGGRPMPRWPC